MVGCLFPNHDYVTHTSRPVFSGQFECTYGGNLRFVCYGLRAKWSAAIISATRVSNTLYSRTRCIVEHVVQSNTLYRSGLHVSGDDCIYIYVD